MTTIAEKLSIILNIKKSIKEKFNLSDELSFSEYVDNIKLDETDITLGVVNEDGNFQPLEFSGTDAIKAGDPMAVSIYHYWDGTWDEDEDDSNVFPPLSISGASKTDIEVTYYPDNQGAVGADRVWNNSDERRIIAILVGDNKIRWTLEIYPNGFPVIIYQTNIVDVDKNPWSSSVEWTATGNNSEYTGTIKVTKV